MKLNGEEVPDRMTHEEAADLFMSTAVGRSTGASREEVLAMLRARFATEAELSAFVQSAKLKLEAMLTAAGGPYTLLDHGHAIRCNFCGMTSHNTQDVMHLYCGKCNRFHERQP